ncbi:MAG: FkbM family methyltransferase [Chitinophagaceae bacterium]|nr:FkbM family methyltransferase [Chitinophagaceae bacterium]
MRKIISKIQFLLDLYQGIGYGTSSIKKEMNSFFKFIPDGKIFVDVGGNKGFYTQGILEIYKPNQIHIFEPSKTNIEILEENFKENKLIFINDCGLSNVNSNSILYSNKSGSALGSLTKRKLDHFGINFSVEENIRLIRFDEYWEKNISEKEIDLLKIDVEGHELEVLEGVGEKIKNVKIIQFEFGGCNIDTRTYFQDYWYFFKKNNFQIYRITPFGNYEIKNYKEEYERFRTTNYFCVNKNLLYLFAS